MVSNGHLSCVGKETKNARSGDTEFLARTFGSQLRLVLVVEVELRDEDLSPRAPSYCGTPSEACFLNACVKN